jgi:hypothetical protein
LLLPVFLGFIVTHAIIIVYGVWVSAGAIPATVANTATESVHGLREQGFWKFFHRWTISRPVY